MTSTAVVYGMKLSPRELQVLAFLAHGCSYKEIGLALSLSPFTVKTHLQHCLRKLGARNRTQAVTIAFVRRLLELPSEQELT